MNQQQKHPRQEAPASSTEGRQLPRTARPRIGADRSLRGTPPPYRWVCPCQEPPVLLATYDPAGKLNIKVRDRYWHLYGFGHVHAICPKCGGEHVLDLKHLRQHVDGELAELEERAIG